MAEFVRGGPVCVEIFDRAVQVDEELDHLAAVPCYSAERHRGVAAIQSAALRDDTDANMRQGKSAIHIFHAGSHGLQPAGQGRGFVVSHGFRKADIQRGTRSKRIGTVRCRMNAGQNDGAYDQNNWQRVSNVRPLLLQSMDCFRPDKFRSGRIPALWGRLLCAFLCCFGLRRCLAQLIQRSLDTLDEKMNVGQCFPRRSDVERDVAVIAGRRNEKSHAIDEWGDRVGGDLLRTVHVQRNLRSGHVRDKQVTDPRRHTGTQDEPPGGHKRGRRHMLAQVRHQPSRNTRFCGLTFLCGLVNQLQPLNGILDILSLIHI